MRSRLSLVLKYLIPRFPIADLPVLLLMTAIGSLIAGSYGILHDQVTYTIGPEYFTNFKFQQFQWADMGLGDRGFVACIGFLATWWVGFIVTWILCRRMLPHHSRRVAFRKVAQGIAIVLATAFLAGLIGYGYGLLKGPDGDYSHWQTTLRQYDVTDTYNFMRVGYIHNAGYIGGLAGLILTFAFVRIDSSESCPTVLSTRKNER